MSKKHETLAERRSFYAFVDLAQAAPITYAVPSYVFSKVIRASPGLACVAGRKYIRAMKTTFVCCSPHTRRDSGPSSWLARSIPGRMATAHCYSAARALNHPPDLVARDSPAAERRRQMVRT